MNYSLDDLLLVIAGQLLLIGLCGRPDPYTTL